jgi:hypothetical protein
MIGVTLIRVSRSNGALEKDVRVEIVAACLYGRAAEHGVEPTRVWITAELERLRNHSPTCLCSEPCQLSRGVTASGVHRGPDQIRGTCRRRRNVRPVRAARRGENTD